MVKLSRRAFSVGVSSALASVTLSACSGGGSMGGADMYGRPGEAASSDPSSSFARRRRVDPEVMRRYGAMYGPVPDEPFPIPAVDLSRIDPAFLREDVDYSTAEPPGTIVVDPKARYLYHVGQNGRARRYGVGVGRAGFSWSGVATVNSKQKWPDWYPPKEMIERDPEIQAQLSDLQSGRGVAGGLSNPLGGRALYLWQDNKDTLYRIHGTFEPWTIGTNVSSGCIRMINQDAIDLYQRTPVGTNVVVLT